MISGPPMTGQGVPAITGSSTLSTTKVTNVIVSAKNMGISVSERGTDVSHELPYLPACLLSMIVVVLMAPSLTSSSL